jgi:hypothetical protein
MLQLLRKLLPRRRPHVTQSGHSAQLPVEPLALDLLRGSADLPLRFADLNARRWGRINLA